jgi:hypothetical protein
MTVALEFINVIVRIDAIRSKYRGGWDQFIEDRHYRIGPLAWFDNYLYRDGAMNGLEISTLLDKLVDAGLNAYRIENGNPVKWIDLCVVEFCRPISICNFRYNLKCDWISFTDTGAYLSGTELDPFAGPTR